MTNTASIDKHIVVRARGFKAAAEKGFAEAGFDMNTCSVGVGGSGKFRTAQLIATPSGVKIATACVYHDENGSYGVHVTSCSEAASANDSAASSDAPAAESCTAAEQEIEIVLGPREPVSNTIGLEIPARPNRHTTLDDMRRIMNATVDGQTLYFNTVNMEGDAVDELSRWIREGIAEPDARYLDTMANPASRELFDRGERIMPQCNYTFHRLAPAELELPDESGIDLTRLPHLETLFGTESMRYAADPYRYMHVPMRNITAADVECFCREHTVLEDTCTAGGENQYLRFIDMRFGCSYIDISATYKSDTGNLHELEISTCLSNGEYLQWILNTDVWVLRHTGHSHPLAVLNGHTMPQSIDDLVRCLLSLADAWYNALAVVHVGVRRKPRPTDATLRCIISQTLHIGDAVDEAYRQARREWGRAKRDARIAAKVGYFSPKAAQWSSEYDRLNPRPVLGSAV